MPPKQEAAAEAAAEELDDGEDADADSLLAAGSGLEFAD